jgi:hypothetical protein
VVLCQAARTPSPRALSFEDSEFWEHEAAFSSPRFQQRYRRWLTDSDTIFEALVSPTIPEALERGTGKFESRILLLSYRRNSSRKFQEPRRDGSGGRDAGLPDPPIEGRGPLVEPSIAIVVGLRLGADQEPGRVVLEALDLHDVEEVIGVAVDQIDVLDKTPEPVIGPRSPGDEIRGAIAGDIEHLIRPQELAARSVHTVGLPAPLRLLVAVAVVDG